MALGAKLCGNGEADGDAQQWLSLQNCFEADPFQALDHSSGSTLGMESVKVIAAALAINTPVADEHIEDGEQPVSDRHRCPLEAAPASQAMEHGGKEAVVRA